MQLRNKYNRKCEEFTEQVKATCSKCFVTDIGVAIDRQLWRRAFSECVVVHVETSEKETDALCLHCSGAILVDKTGPELLPNGSPTLSCQGLA